MVHTIRSGPSELRWVVRPNRSLTSGQAGLVFIAIATLVLAIGMGFYWLGLTLILPFSGFEVVVLGGGFYACLLRGQLREVISISGDRVVVERGRWEPSYHREFQRYWVRVISEPSPHASLA